MMIPDGEVLNVGKDIDVERSQKLELRLEISGDTEVDPYYLYIYCKQKYSFCTILYCITVWYDMYSRSCVCLQYCKVAKQCKLF